eukprot:1276180-Rhodomonas_salina.6
MLGGPTRASLWTLALEFSKHRASSDRVSADGRTESQNLVVCKVVLLETRELELEAALLNVEVHVPVDFDVPQLGRCDFVRPDPLCPALNTLRSASTTTHTHKDTQVDRPPALITPSQPIHFLLPRGIIIAILLPLLPLLPLLFASTSCLHPHPPLSHHPLSSSHPRITVVVVAAAAVHERLQL